MLKPDKQILSQIRKSDVGAYKYLFEQYYKELYYFARKFLDNKEVAEELVQDVFINIWENKQALSINKSIKSYLYTSVKNRSLNYLKSKINNLNFVSVDRVDSGRYERGADQSLEAKELNELIQKAVSSLPPRCREMFHLSRNAEMTYQEIADALGVSKETVKSQISEAIKKIKAFLGEHWGHFPL